MTYFWAGFLAGFGVGFIVGPATIYVLMTALADHER